MDMFCILCISEFDCLHQVELLILMWVFCGSKFHEVEHHYGSKVGLKQFLLASIGGCFFFSFLMNENFYSPNNKEFHTRKITGLNITKGMR